MQGKWIVSRCRRDYLYADKDNEKLKLMSQYDLNKDKIVSNSQTLSRLSNIDKIEEKAKLQNEIIRAQEQNVKLSEHIHCSTLSQLESNNIYISIFNDKLISFYFLNTRNTIIPQKELKKKLDLCENFAQEMQRNAIIRIFCNSESDVKILQSQYNKINGKSFNPLVPTKVLIVAKPEVKLKNEAVKALIGGWKLCGIF